MAIHRKLKQTYQEAIAEVAARALRTVRAEQTATNGTISVTNADGTRTVIGVGAGTDETGASTGIEQFVGDTTPPGTPDGVAFVTGNGCITGVWGGSLDGGVPADFDHLAFRIDGEEFGSVSVPGSATSSSLEDGTTYTCDAVAYDVQGNASDACDAVEVECEDALVRTTALEQTDEEIKATATAAYETATSASETATSASETATTASETATSAVEMAAAASETATAAYEAASEVTITAESILEQVSETYVTSEYLSTNYTTTEETSTAITDAITSELYDDEGNSIYASTTLIRESGDGVEVARLVDGEYTSSKTLIDDEGFYIQNQDGENLARFTADTVELGMNGAGTYNGASTTSNVYMCDRNVRITSGEYDSGGTFTCINSLIDIGEDDSAVSQVTLGVDTWDGEDFEESGLAVDSLYMGVEYDPDGGNRALIAGNEVYANFSTLTVDGYRSESFGQADVADVLGIRVARVEEDSGNNPSYWTCVRLMLDGSPYALCSITFECASNAAVTTSNGQLYRSSALTLPDWPVEYSEVPAFSVDYIDADSGYNGIAFCSAYAESSSYDPQDGPGPVMLFAPTSKTIGHPKFGIIAFGAIEDDGWVE